MLGLAHASGAQPHGAVDSRSAHEPTSADEALEHEHGPRHGGFFGDAEDIFHYELVLEPGNRLVFYVNDAVNAPLDVRGLQGRWTLNPDGAVPLSGAFTPSDDGAYFFTTLPASFAADPIHIEAAVLKDGSWVGMEFVLPREPQLSTTPSPGSATY